MENTIYLNQPYMSGRELEYIRQAVDTVKIIRGDGLFTKKCHQFFEEKYGFPKCLLTTSCTDALEMSAILLNIQPGDEVIMPAFTFVSTANAFALRGAKIIFADSMSRNPNIDADALETLISKRTKAIVVVHYAGVACDMQTIMTIAEKHNLYVVEDAAQAIDNYYIYPDGKKVPLGSIGHLAAFSFHETKNIISGEGGLLVINDEKFKKRAEIIWEKGTNRAAFFRGEIDKYGWVDIGSSFLPSDIIAAFLFAQLELIDVIQKKRKLLWQSYHEKLSILRGRVQMPDIPDYSTNNAHMYYIVCEDIDERSLLIEHCKKQNIHPVFHYQSLNKSPYFAASNHKKTLPNSDYYSNGLLRLPLYYELQLNQVDFITSTILSFYGYKEENIVPNARLRTGRGTTVSV